EVDVVVEAGTDLVDQDTMLLPDQVAQPLRLSKEYCPRDEGIGRYRVIPLPRALLKEPRLVILDVVSRKYASVGFGDSADQSHRVVNRRDDDVEACRMGLQLVFVRVEVEQPRVRP